MIQAGAAGVIPSDEVEGVFVVTGGKAEFRRLRTGITGREPRSARQITVPNDKAGEQPGKQ